MTLTLTDEEFRNGPYIIDGHRFVHCRFVNMHLIYQAEDEVEFHDCIFEGCTWTFSDAASRVLGFLSTLQEQVLPDGPNIVEGVFRSILNGTVTTVRNARPELEPAHAGGTADPISVSTS